MEVVRTHNQSSPTVLPRVRRGSGMCKISVTGGKGGVGKTTIAVNLALALSNLGGRVLLIDGDLGLANADQLLGVQAQKTLYDVIKGKMGIEDAMLKTPFDIHLLPACSGRKEMEDLSESARSDLIDNINNLEDQFDFVVMDTAAGIGNTAMDLVSSTDIVLTVVTPDPTSNRDAFSVMKILSKEYTVKRIELVVNKVASVDAGLSVYSRISKVISRFLPMTLGLAGVVVRDACMAKSVLERYPLLASYPHSPASKQIAKLAEHVVTTVNQSRTDEANGDNEGRQSS